ncbi:MAG: hypothetical protein NT175_02220 [Bacteroidetes bacterium]|nr:hypothetical protein [Bacteroidota bacterium]
MKSLFVIFCSAFLCFYSLAQESDPYQILGNVTKNLDRIKDYQADVEIELDVDFIRMPVKHATAYYKQPDKVTFKSDEFIMLPKKGFDFSANKILKEDFTAIYIGEEEMQGQLNDVIQVIPTKRKSDIVLSTFWIDKGNNRITKAESTTRNKGSYVIEFSYDKPADPLPSVMKISFEIENFNIPLKFMGKSIEVDEKKMNEQTVKTGAVYIRFSNYRINKEVEDQLFTEPEK